MGIDIRESYISAGVTEQVTKPYQLRKDKSQSLKPIHNLTPQWQNIEQRTIDYDKYPELKDCEHLIGLRDDGTPYLYRAVIYDTTVRIPKCISDFDKNAFDYDVLCESAYSHNLSFEKNNFVLVLETNQENLELSDDAMLIFNCIKTTEDKILYESKPLKSDNQSSLEFSALPFTLSKINENDDIPF